MELRYVEWLSLVLMFAGLLCWVGVAGWWVINVILILIEHFGIDWFLFVGWLLMVVGWIIGHFSQNYEIKKKKVKKK